MGRAGGGEWGGATDWTMDETRRGRAKGDGRGCCADIGDLGRTRSESSPKMSDNGKSAQPAQVFVDRKTAESERWKDASHDDSEAVGRKATRPLKSNQY